jgi:hypothetical protein
MSANTTVDIKGSNQYLSKQEDTKTRITVMLSVLAEMNEGNTHHLLF